VGSDGGGFAPLPPGAIDRLLAFRPTFEHPSFVPGIARGGTDDGSGTIEWPWFEYAPDVTAFEQVLYGDGWIVGFDWPEWQDEGRRLVEGNGVESADLDDLRRLLTVIFRKERFCEGTVAAAFDDGLLVRVLRRVDRLAADASCSRGC
jgi:hypothetical protein